MGHLPASARESGRAKPGARAFRGRHHLAQDKTGLDDSSKAETLTIAAIQDGALSLVEADHRRIVRDNPQETRDGAPVIARPSLLKLLALFGHGVQDDEAAIHDTTVSTNRVIQNLGDGA